MAERRSSVPLRSAAFRFGLLLALLFATGCALLLATVERQIGRYATEATGGALQTEATVLAGEYGELGIAGLTDAIERHSHAGAEAQFRYLLIDASGRRLLGTLPGRAAHEGWSTTDILEHEDGAPWHQPFATLGTRLKGGLLLVIATDNYDVDNLRQRLSRFTIVSGIVITLLALVGGYVIGNLFLARLARVNRVVDRIIEGERSERLPAIGFGPEFDELTRNLNRMLDRNAAAMEALRQVSTNIAHDLRTPLSRLHQHLEDMRDDATIPSAPIDAAQAQTDNLLAIIQALLRIGTLEGGVGRQRFTRVDLSELLDRIHQAFEPVAEDAGHVLLADHAAGVFVEGDAELLAQLLTNLIENAIVHTPPGTRITSRLAIVGGAATIDVSDTGPGIPAEERTKVFARFYRLDASRHSDGAGLGLALVAAVAGLHQATAAVEDSEVGLCIRIVFPKGPTAA